MLIGTVQLVNLGRILRWLVNLSDGGCGIDVLYLGKSEGFVFWALHLLVLNNFTFVQQL